MIKYECGRCRALTAVAVTMMIAGLVDTTGGSAATERSIFGLSRASDIVAVVAVEGVTSSSDGRLRVFALRIDAPLRGDVIAGQSVSLVQENFSSATRPLFEVGARTLILAVPLPAYTYFKQALPPGSYLRWTERLASARDVDGLGAPDVASAIRSYLAVADDPEAAARVLASLLTVPRARLRREALMEISARRELAALVDARALEAMPAFLADERVPVGDRAQILIGLARAGVTAVAPIAEAIQATVQPLRPAAVDALVALGRAPAEVTMLAYADNDDPALRVAAVRGLAQNGSPQAVARVGVMVASDPSTEVVVAALRALGGVRTPEAVAAIAPALQSTDRQRLTAAGEALGRIATPEAVQLLAKTLADGTFESQTVAAFGLAQANRQDARDILEEQEESHPDPRIRKTCRIALGESTHEH